MISRKIYAFRNRWTLTRRRPCCRTGSSESFRIDGFVPPAETDDPAIWSQHLSRPNTRRENAGKLLGRLRLTRRRTGNVGAEQALKNFHGDAPAAVGTQRKNRHATFDREMIMSTSIRPRRAAGRLPIGVHWPMGTVAATTALALITARGSGAPSEAKSESSTTAPVSAASTLPASSASIPVPSSAGTSVFAASSSARSGMSSSLSSSSAPATATSGAVGGIDWKPCKAKNDRATVSVPVDWREPGGQQITLAVIRHPASEPTQRIGTIFLNPGGPGDTGVGLIKDEGDDFDHYFGGRFDIIS